MDPFEERLAEGLRSTVPHPSPELRRRVLAHASSSFVQGEDLGEAAPSQGFRVSFRRLSFQWKMAVAFASVILLHTCVVGAMDRETVNIVCRNSSQTPAQYMASVDRLTISEFALRSRLLASLTERNYGETDKEKSHGGI